MEKKLWVVMGMVFGLIIILPLTDALLEDPGKFKRWYQQFEMFRSCFPIYNYTNNTFYFGGHAPAYYLGAAADGITDAEIAAFVNRTGDTMTGDLNISTGTEYVNISAGEGSIDITGDLIIGKSVINYTVNHPILLDELLVFNLVSVFVNRSLFISENLIVEQDMDARSITAAKDIVWSGAAYGQLGWGNLTDVPASATYSGIYVNRTGDVMTGDLNISTGTEYVNISAEGKMNISDNVTITGRLCFDEGRRACLSSGAALPLVANDDVIFLSGGAGDIQTFAATGEFDWYSHTGIDGTGTWEPYWQIGAGFVAILSEDASYAPNRQLRLTFPDDVRILKGNLTVVGNVTTNAWMIARQGGYVQRVLNVYSGSGYVNITASTGSVNISNDLTIDSELIVDGKVGIGTTSPEQKLDVAGGIKISAGHAATTGSFGAIDYSAPIFRLYSQGTDAATRGAFAFYIRESDFGNALTPLEIQTDGDVILAQTAGKVGIGTTTPDEKLEIAGAGTQRLQITETGSTVETQLKTSTTAGYVGTTTNHPFYLQANNQNYLTILADGKVGIGDTSPASTLTVHGDARAYSGSGYVNITGSTGNINMNGALTIDTSAVIGLTVTSTGSVYAVIETTAVGDNYAGWKVSAGGDPWGFYVGADGHPLLAGDFGIYDHDGGAYRLVVKDDGKVGIGMTSPEGMLDIDVGAAAYVIIRRETANQYAGALRFIKTRSNTPADGDYSGSLLFQAEDSAGGLPYIAEIKTIITDVTDGTEDGAILFLTMAGGAARTERMRVDASGITVVQNVTVTEDIVANADIWAPNMPGSTGHTPVTIDRTDGLLYYEAATPKVYDYNGTFIGTIMRGGINLMSVFYVNVNDSASVQDRNFTFYIREEDPELVHIDYVWLGIRFEKQLPYYSISWVNITKPITPSTARDRIADDDGVYIDLRQWQNATVVFSGAAIRDIINAQDPNLYDTVTAYLIAKGSYELV